jgi:GNAT superfamily N-acetyltransferase
MTREYDISDDPARLDVARIHAFLTRSYWSAGIPLTTVEKAIRNSICFAAYHPIDGLVGFARAVTDRATFAYLADVFVLEAHRGRGLSKKLVGELLAHPDLQGLRRMMLATRDAHALYAQFGFAALAAPGRFMERHDPDVYRR